jgi:opacity protein-like surface antigen
MNFDYSKRIFLILFFLTVLISLLGTNLLAQKNNSSDYFAIGIYSGSYIGQRPLYEKNSFINLAAIEVEYFKFTDLSFYLQGFYQFTGNDVRRLNGLPARYSLSEVKNPTTYRVNISFGGRYYLRDKTVNPFFQAGLSHETNYIGRYSYRITYSGSSIYEFAAGRYIYNLSVDLGAGVSVRVSDRVKLELKYDLYKSITKSSNEFTGFSVLGGVKFVL